jgi:hypothetical protein
VNAIVPDTRAESNLPEGAIVTDRLSMMSTYISFEVCRMPGRRQGNAVDAAAALAASVCFKGFVEESPGDDVL